LIVTVVWYLGKVEAASIFKKFVGSVLRRVCVVMGHPHDLRVRAELANANERHRQRRFGNSDKSGVQFVGGIFPAFGEPEYERLMLVPHRYDDGGLQVVHVERAAIGNGLLRT
jgi:hypothetical protein